MKRNPRNPTMTVTPDNGDRMAGLRLTWQGKVSAAVLQRRMLAKMRTIEQRIAGCRSPGHPGDHVAEEVDTGTSLRAGRPCPMTKRRGGKPHEKETAGWPETKGATQHQYDESHRAGITNHRSDTPVAIHELIFKILPRSLRQGQQRRWIEGAMSSARTGRVRRRIKATARCCASVLGED